MSALRAPQEQLARTEADLIGAVRSGDDGAFGELYSRYGGRILGYVGGIVRDHGRAEDIAQDVFISALRAMRSSDRAIAFKPWIYEIARNACIDEFRRIQRSPEVPVAGDEAVAARPGLAQTTPSPDAYLERRQQLDDLRGAFGGLPESQHKVLVLRELEGRSYTQIAERTGMSVPMVESTLFRARRRLSREYEEIVSGRRCEQVVQVIDGGGEEALLALGLRERRRFARHISHCQPCRRNAYLAGIDESALRVPSIAKKIAALLPFPFAPWRHLFGGGRISRAVRSLQRTASVTDPGTAAGMGQTAVAVAVAAIAVGGGATGALQSPAQRAPTYAVRPAQVTSARLWPGPPRTVSVQSAQSARPSHHSAKPARSNRSARPSSQVQTKPASAHPGSPFATTSTVNTNPSVPSVPSPPGLPSLPQLRLPSTTQLLKTTTSILHRTTTSTTKQLTRLLNKLPGSLKSIIQLP